MNIKIKKILLFLNLILALAIFVSCANKKSSSSNMSIIESSNASSTSPSSSIKDASSNIPSNSEETIKKSPLGTWWWNKNLDVDEYLEFAVNNDITEIYFCDYSLGDNLKTLLQKANNYDINIYLLLGEKEWLNDRSDLDTIINNYISFQNNNEYKLSGIHLDVEPHQFSDFSDNRATYLYKLIDFIKTNKELYNDISFDYDIPFWLDDEIEYNSISKPTYKHIIDYADRIFIMSYRDTASAMLDVSIDEINYANDNNKIIYLSAETYSEEGDHVSYLEEGKAYMINELKELRKLIPDDFGIAIHNIKSFKELKD
ncbi:MAG: hypothetical protein K6A63_05670 [Acholeplasmatales bacterium]|nr:hypothetical protein [Acholeplasmatales bacterium]